MERTGNICPRCGGSETEKTTYGYVCVLCDYIWYDNVTFQHMLGNKTVRRDENG